MECCTPHPRRITHHNATKHNAGSSLSLHHTRQYGRFSTDEGKPRHIPTARVVQTHFEEGTRPGIRSTVMPDVGGPPKYDHRECYLKPIRLVLLIVLLGVGVVGTAILLKPSPRPIKPQFEGQLAYQDVLAQVSLGPRTSGSPAHTAVIEYIYDELTKAGWQVTIQDAIMMGHPVENILAQRSDSQARLILGAHYDTRLIAEHDPDPSRRGQPGPGANDGASGVAVLLELARTLPRDTVPIQLVFFDAEDNGGIPGWDWILGSKAFVQTLTMNPEAMILVDMVGDADLTLPMEQNSDSALTRSIWDTAQSLGYGDVFLSRGGLQILDDHIPFLNAGIPSVDIIDIAYPYWHTSQDTPDKISAKSLQVVGDTLLAWIQQYQP